jgi:uncharacterized protein YndB with AHSA1/START domain
MIEQPTGTVTRDGNEYSLLLERDYPMPIEHVWKALVEPKQLARWLGTVTHDGRIGGSFHIDFGDAEAGGTILAYDPPRSLAFEWGERGEPSVVRFDLAPSDRGTRLRLTHTRQSAQMAAGTAPGWHAHLDVFGVILEGGEFDLENDYGGLYTAAKICRRGAGLSALTKHRPGAQARTSYLRPQSAGSGSRRVRTQARGWLPAREPLQPGWRERD